jgi:hypothetical protein
MIVQTDDERILNWCNNARISGGSFVVSIASAALSADSENYKIIRPAIVILMEKYPRYLEK